MRNLGIIITCVAAVLLGSTAYGIRAKRDVQTVFQPDGTMLQVKKIGDEFGHYLLTDDGYIVYETDEGYYEYGTFSETGAVRSTGIRIVPNAKIPTAAVNISTVDLTAVEQLRKTNGPRRAPQTGKGMSETTYPLTGSPRGLIILVAYKDVGFTLSDPKAYFDDMINGANFKQYGGTGSALQYFKDQSGGIFIPQFDVLGPVTLPNNRSYYGANDYWGDDSAPEQMVTHAISILDPTVDFSKYDTDGDGVIDNVYIFYAGQGEASYGPKNSVWPHSWDVRSAGVNMVVDKVRVGHYACSNEWELNSPDGIGTFVHEFSHVMGLPDLYYTGSASGQYYTPGDYSVLDYGPYNNNGRTPPNYGAYELNALGWYEPLMLDGPMSVSLNTIDSKEFGLIATAKDNEFFLFENRQKKGWDAYIPGHGMLVWHIDYNASVFRSNAVNNTKSHQYVDIEEANGNPDGTNATAMAGWPFPGTSKKTSFTSSTSPALRDWSNNAIDLPITNIREEGDLVLFDVAGGKVPLSTPDCTEGVKDVPGRYFVAEWGAVDGANDYVLTVYACLTGDSGVVSTGFDNSKLSDGWNATATGFYDTSGNYGESSPSFKFNNTYQTLTSPVLDGDVTSIKFWIKGQSNNDNTYLTIQGLTGSNWVDIEKIVPKSNVDSTVEITSIPSGVRQVRFTMTKSSGNIAVDDIEIAFGASSEVLEDYNGISTGGATRWVVDKIKEDSNLYYFTVQAVNGNDRSAVSAPVYVTVSSPTGVEDLDADAATEQQVEYYNLQGVRIDRAESGSIVIRRTGTKVEKVIVR